MTCRQGVELEPESIDSRTAYGDLYRVTGQAEKALSQYQSVINRHPRAVDAWLGIGGALNRIAQEIGQTVSAAIVIALLAREATIFDGIRSVMVLLVALSLIGAPLASRLQARGRSPIG